MSNVTDNICKIRDLIIVGEHKKILSGLGLFRSTYSLVNRNIERFIKNDGYKLDFTSDDLLEMSMECKTFLSNLNNQISATKMVKEITSLTEINDVNVKDFTCKYADIFTMVAHLTEFHNIVSYSASLLKILEWQYEQQDINFVIIDVIKKALRG